MPSAKKPAAVCDFPSRVLSDFDYMADWTIPRHDRLRFDIMSGKINE